MTPAIIAIVLGTGLLALVPTRRLADRTADRWVVAGYYLVVWLLIAGLVLVPPLRRIGVPLLLLLAIAPWLSVRAGIARLLRRDPPRPPPRNVTPPEAGGPVS